MLRGDFHTTFGPSMHPSAADQAAVRRGHGGAAGGAAAAARRRMGLGRLLLIIRPGRKRGGIC